MSAEHILPAARGLMGTENYYVAIVPLGVVTRLISFRDWATLPPELRAQRVLNTERVPAITKYILENPDDWVFSSLTVSYDGEVHFEPSRVDPELGRLRIPMKTKLLINDGQHRFAAIQQAIDADPTLGDQTVSVVLFPARSLERSQQIFSDLNRTVRKTSRSLDILYDHRDLLNELTLRVAEETEIFRGRVEKEKVSLAPRSSKLVTLSALYSAHQELLNGDEQRSLKGQRQREALVAAVTRYWTVVGGHIREWKMVHNGSMSPAEARTESISANAAVLWALGRVGQQAWIKWPKTWENQLVRLNAIDWRRTNAEWQGINMIGPDVVNRRQTRAATADFIAWKLGMRTKPPAPVLEPPG